MSNINNNMQTQTSNTLHNAIMEAGSKDRPPMLAPGNYIQWKSKIKRYIDTKPNQELIHYYLENPPYELGWKEKAILDSEGNPTTSTERVFEMYKNVKQEIRDQLNTEAEAVQIILTGIDNDIYSTVDACLNACEMWKAIERLKQGESINVQDLETNLFWEFGKFMSLDGESLKSYYSRFYKMMNELTRNQCKVTNHQVNVQFLLQLQPEWQRTQQAATRNRGKAIVNSPQPIYYQEPSMVDDDDETSKDKEIDKLIDLISLSQRSGNVARARETVGSSMVQKFGIKCYNYKEYGHVARECQKSKRVKDAVYHREKMLLLEKLKSEIADFKNKNKSLTEASNKLSEENDLLYADFKKSKAELQRRNSIEYASKMELECAKVRGDLLSYKMEYQRSYDKYTQTINDLNQTISEMQDKLSAHQDTISILKQQKDTQIKLYKTREDKEIEKVIDLENKVKVLDNIVYKTGQSVQTMNMLNNKCQTSFTKPEFLKKAKQANPRLYDIGCYNLALMLSPESDEVIRLEKESRSKLSDLVRPFDYAKLNSLYDLFVPQREKSSEQRFFSERSRISHINVQREKKKESFQKQTTFLETRMDESIPVNKKCQSSLEIVNIQRDIN
nr:hypothetical protein [Tanacetum cinerariifolium]